MRGGRGDEGKMEMLLGREEEPKGVLHLSAVTSHNHAQLFEDHPPPEHTIHSTKRQPQRKSDTNFKSEDRERLIHCVPMYELADSDVTNNFISIS